MVRECIRLGNVINYQGLVFSLKKSFTGAFGVNILEVPSLGNRNN